MALCYKGLLPQSTYSADKLKKHIRLKFHNDIVKSRSFGMSFDTDGHLIHAAISTKML